MAKADQKSSLLPKRTLLLGVMLMVVLQICNSRGISSGYSYWGDEAFSAATAQANWSSFFFEWVLPDTAPPLYPILLKLWQSATGFSEVSSRFLSFLFSSAALAITSFYAFCRGKRKTAFFASIFFLGTSPIFSRYAQETRNYALVLLLASIVITSFLGLSHTDGDKSAKRQPERLFRLSSLLLSLTHYFAFIYSFALVCFKILLSLLSRDYYKRELSRDLLNLLVLIAFPLYHLILFRKQSSSTLLAWNKVEPFWGTLANFVKSMLDWALGSPALIALILGLASLSIFAYPRFAVSLKREIFILAGSTILFLFFIVAIDIVTQSFSTDRNFIVSIPAITLILAFLSQGIAQSFYGKKVKVISAVLGLYLALQQFNAGANNLLYGKLVPYENYKQVAALLDQTKACEEYRCASFKLGNHLKEVYFSKRSNSLEPLVLESNTSSPSQLIVVHSGAPNLDELKQYGITGESHKCFQPVQAWNKSVVVISPYSFADKAVDYRLQEIGCN